MSILKELTITSYRVKKDKTAILTMQTEVLSADDVKEIHEHQDEVGIMYYTLGTQMNAEVEKAINEYKLHSVKGKTSSQKLRGVLYVLYSKEKRTESFSEFYEKRMQQMIQHFKDKL